MVNPQARFLRPLDAGDFGEQLLTVFIHIQLLGLNIPRIGNSRIEGIGRHLPG
jgi:hypothetical protein